MRVVVVGGGFAGLGVLKALSGLDVLLLSKDFFYDLNVFDGLSVDSRFKVRLSSFAKRYHARFKRAFVRPVDHSSKKVFTDSGVFKYDVLVLTVGDYVKRFSKSSEEYVIDDFSDAVTLRHHVNGLLRLLRRKSFEEQKASLTFVVESNSLRGVSLILALRRLVLDWCKVHSLDSEAPFFYLVGKDVFSGVDPLLRSSLVHELESLGVSLLFNTSVVKFSGGRVFLDNSAEILSHTFVNDFRVGNPLFFRSHFHVDDLGFGLVDDFGFAFDNVFVGGSARSSEMFFSCLDAFREGYLLGLNVRRLLAGRSLKVLDASLVDSFLFDDVLFFKLFGVVFRSGVLGRFRSFRNALFFKNLGS